MAKNLFEKLLRYQKKWQCSQGRKFSTSMAFALFEEELTEADQFS